MRKYYSKKDIPLTTQENFYSDRRDIEKWLKEMRITDYYIRPDGKVDCSGTIFIAFRHLKRIPVKFGVVDGSFDCSYNELTTLEGSPDEVKRGFYCKHNKLTSLRGAPKYVGGDYDCSENKLISLDGVPKNIYSGFACNNNPLTILEHGPENVYGPYRCFKCKLKTLDGLPEHIGGYLMCWGNEGLSREYLEQFDFSFVEGRVFVGEIR